MKERLQNILMWVVIVLIVLLSALNVFLTLHAGASHEEYVDRKVEELKKIQLIKPTVVNGINGKNGSTPVKGVDYFDGKDGSDGADGKDGERGETGSQGPAGVDGEDGLTPVLRCNEIKNRWEIKYETTETWRVLGETATKCTTGE